MSATKILWSQLILVGTVVLAFVWTATEWTAWRLAFQPELGRPWAQFLGWRSMLRPRSFGGGSHTTLILTESVND